MWRRGERHGGILDKRSHLPVRKKLALLSHVGVLYAAKEDGMGVPARGARIMVGIMNPYSPIKNAMCKRWFSSEFAERFGWITRTSVVFTCGAWGSGSSYDILELFDGAVWDEDLWHHLSTSPHAPDDPVSEEGEAFRYMGDARFLL